MKRMSATILKGTFALLLGIAATGAANAQSAYSTSKELGSPGLPIAVPKGSFKLIGTLRLPPGHYVATASHYLQNTGPSGGPGQQSSPGVAYCLLVLSLVGAPPAPVANAQAMDILKGDEVVSQALTVAGTLSTDGAASVLCTNNGSNGTLQVNTFNLNAIRVTDLMIQ